MRRGEETPPLLKGGNMAKKKDLKYYWKIKPFWLVTVDLKIKCRQKFQGEIREEMDFSFEFMQKSADLSGERTVETANQMAAKFFERRDEYYIKSITLKNHD